MTCVTYMLPTTVTEMVLVSGHCLVVNDRDFSTARYIPIDALFIMTTTSFVCRGNGEDIIVQMKQQNIHSVLCIYMMPMSTRMGQLPFQNLISAQICMSGHLSKTLTPAHNFVSSHSLYPIVHTPRDKLSESSMV